MKSLLLGVVIAAAVCACATTTSPTGRTQRVGAVSQQQLDQILAAAGLPTEEQEGRVWSSKAVK